MGRDLFYFGYDNKQKSMLKYDISAEALGNNVADNPCLDEYWEMFYAGVDVCNNAFLLSSITVHSGTYLIALLQTSTPA